MNLAPDAGFTPSLFAQNWWMMADVTNAEMVTSIRAQMKAIIDFGMENYSIDQQNVARLKLDTLAGQLKYFENKANYRPRCSNSILSVD